MLNIETPPQYMEIIQHPNHFYELIFISHKADRKTLDEWFSYLEQIYQFPKETNVKILLDTRKALTQPPLTYAVSKQRDLMRRYPNRPTEVYLAFLGVEVHGILNKMLGTFLQVLRIDRHFAFFYGDKRQEAIDFLFAHDLDNHPDRASV